MLTTPAVSKPVDDAEQGFVLRDLTYDYRRLRAPRRRGRPALGGVSARASSSAVALLGPNGAGKSTLFRILSTSTSASGGSFAVAGYDSAGSAGSLAEYRRRIGVVPQRFRAPHGYTCREVLAYVAWLRQVPRAAVADNIAEALVLTGLAEYGERKIGTLSGGTLQRVALAQALVSRPRLLLLDEPTVGLDPAQRESFLANLGEVRRRGTTTLLATHLVEDVAVFAHEVVVLNEGRCAYAGRLASFAETADGQPVPGAAISAAYQRIIETGADG
ncbi:ABC transporter ATP-binding protein [Nocardioides panacihumi]|uniref:ABC transporter ATP-binding protein n=1 Tax=Nocardioides panacihumi TaxID=400774 RepID=A0ABP5BPE0_9ACTN